MRILMFGLVIFSAFAADVLFADPSTMPTTAPAGLPVIVVGDKAVNQSLARYGKQMADAVSNGEVTELLDLMNPAVVEKVGGKEKLRQILENGEKEMQDDGVKMKSVVVGDPDQVLSVGNMMYAMLPQTIEMSVPKGTLETKSFLIGISDDQGKTWSFIDGAAGERTIRKVMPDIPVELKFKEHTKPVFTPDAGQ